MPDSSDKKILTNVSALKDRAPCVLGGERGLVEATAGHAGFLTVVPPPRRSSRRVEVSVKVLETRTKTRPPPPVRRRRCPSYVSSLWTDGRRAALFLLLPSALAVKCILGRSHRRQYPVRNGRAAVTRRQTGGEAVRLSRRSRRNSAAPRSSNPISQRPTCPSPHPEFLSLPWFIPVHYYL